MFLFCLVSSLFACSILAANCYHPNGQIFTYAGYVPCKPRVPGAASMCCATDRANFPDECSPDGLCRNGDDIYRDDCTDPTWKSPGCLQLCTTGFGNTGEDVGNPEGQQASDIRLPIFLHAWQSLLNPYFTDMNPDQRQT